ncbi:isoleucine--tRNA ligase [Mycoplasmopsis gallopavonis]|uniref:Isoleucine--tRNA ligase n=1 Tax=Mycoplasmopsis gallopavonis TaxID=76629 RepID=A0A449AZH9_9BACT|nr:isoleucine--tRNA ligase [Mycoplasmopsis gallopavonis]RIV16796.1 isoleucine--tRNA ligase [Mycoplasmopsis gallopavonis]VEU72920.1 Isoleucine--tRNA ligase [Mycoplasmopsis gallopavonis]
MDYKKTLNMPKTGFDMRANLIQKEPNFRKAWLDNQIYKKVLAKNANNTSFILHDGPPYANGSIHVGHAMNKVLKDIIVRYKSLKGFYSPFVAGWDTHGLPIEHKMLLEAKLSKDELTPIILRKKAAKYALKQVENQKKEFATLQLFSDLEKIYITLDKNYEAKQLEVFKKMVLDGLVYKGLKPVYWSPSSQSALAEAEVEYQDVVSPSIYVAFEVANSKFDKLQKGDKLIIWTTTPWTLIANAGVALGENLEYLIVEVNAQRYVLAGDLFEQVKTKLAWENPIILDTFFGKDLHDVNYYTPITHLEAPVVLGHHVTSESGTGLVHIAPLFGEDDFQIGLKHKLNMIMHISDTGFVENSNTQFDGLFYEDANKPISEFLGTNMLHFERFKHSYPHDWRTHKPIIFRGTPQWFVSIDQIRSKILEQIESNVTTYPEWAKARLLQMIENRHDWTISRQRTWGVPIIIFYDQDKNPVIKEEIFDYVINLVQQYGTDIWWEKETDELLPEAYRNLGYTREMDIMDVWFDSGVSSIAVDIDPKLESPYDLYLEGVDQYRGWFNSSIINSVAYKGVTPYKNLISHGFTLDGKGEKMSKSKGNTILPQEVISKRGADILRLWVANSEYTNDVTISEEILDQNTEVYRKLRNTIKFLLGNLNEYKYNPEQPRTGIHAYIKEKLNELILNVTKAYDEYKFINVVKLINNYVVDLSSFYLSVTKDILYVRATDDLERQMVLANLYEITDFLIIALAPILPTTAEDAYSYFAKETKFESVMLEDFPKVQTVDFELIASYQEFFDLRDQVNILIENQIKEGLIKRSNEAKVTLASSSDLLTNLDLKTLLMVGKIEQGSSLAVSKFDSLKCERCWNHFEANQIQDNLCPTCYEIIQKLEN